jgi:hypothetical protein
MADYRTLQAELGQAPDAGNAAIAARFAAGLGPAKVAGSAEAGGSTEGGGGGGRGLVSPDDTWLLEMQPGVLAAAGTIDLNDWGPPPGWVWRLTEVTFVFGTGCTLISVYRNSSLGGAALLFQATSSGVWEPSRRFLANGERLVAVANGACVISPDGERIATGFLPTYLA